MNQSLSVFFAKVRRSPWILLLVLVVLWLVVQLSIGKSFFWDTTEEGLYTLSKGTRTMVSELKEPVTIRFYYSRALGQQAPQYGAFAERIMEVLRAYRDLSGGKIILHQYDPAPFSDQEDEAISIGLKGIRSANGEKFYLGLVATNSGDGKQVIPFFPIERESYLEYDLTQALFKLTHPVQKTLGVLSTVPLLGQASSPFGGGAQAPWLIMDQLKTFFNIQAITTNVSDISADIDLLMVVQPQGLNDMTLAALDRFVRRGGRLLMFIDPFVEILGQSSSPELSAFSPALVNLLQGWGIQMDNTRFVADAKLGRRVTGDVGGYEREITYYGWLSLPRSVMNENDVIMADIDTIAVASAGSLTVLPGSKLKHTTLMSSSAESALMDVSYIRPTPDVARLLKDFSAGGQPLPLAMKIEGPLNQGVLQTTNKDTAKTTGQGPVPVKIDRLIDNRKMPTAAQKEVQAIKTAPDQQAHIVVISDVDMLYDAFWVQKGQMMGQVVAIPTAHNATLVQNALGYLSGNTQMMSVRPRAVKARTLTVLDTMQRQAEEAFQVKEQKTRQNMEVAESKLNDLMKDGAAAGEAQEVVIRELQAKLVALRQDLRGIQRSLRQDVTHLQQKLWILNILVMPVLVILFAFFLLGRARKIRLF